MPILLHQPDPPPVPLEQCSDAERRIGRKCWGLEELQQEVSAGRMRIVLTTTAAEDAGVELQWCQADVEAFFLALSAHRYESSEWCLPPQHGNQWGPIAADAYAMGYDRIKEVENQQRRPYIYIKFAVRNRSVLVFSLHPSRFN